jgi:drug/metabolite transporter (DMT)-like permease
MIWLLIASLLWGPSFGLIDLLRTQHGMDSYTLGFLRMFYSLLLFLPLMQFKGLGRRLPWRLALLGAVQFGLMYVTYLHAFRFLRPPEVALCTVFTPLFVSLLCNLQDRRFCPMTFFFVTLAIAGATVIRWANPSSEFFWRGFALMQVSNLCFALGQVGYRKLAADRAGFSDLRLFGWMYLGAFAVTFAAWIADDPGKSLVLIQGLSLRGWSIVLWLGLIPSGLAFFLFNHGATRVDEGTLAIFNDLKIPIALLILFALFGEAHRIENWRTFAIGACLMLLALACNERWRQASARREATLLDSESTQA